MCGHWQSIFWELAAWLPLKKQMEGAKACRGSTENQRVFVCLGWVSKPEKQTRNESKTEGDD